MKAAAWLIPRGLQSGANLDGGRGMSRPMTKTLTLDDEDCIRNFVRTTLNRDERPILLAVGEQISGRSE